METTKKLQKSGKKAVLKVILFILAAIILGALMTALSAVFPVYLKKASDIFNITYGAPFPFLNQITTLVANDGYFPRYFVPQFFHEAFDTVIYWDKLILSLLVWIAVSAAVLAIICVIHHFYRKKFPKKEKPKKQQDEYRNVFD